MQYGSLFDHELFSKLETNTMSRMPRFELLSVKARILIYIQKLFGATQECFSVLEADDGEIVGEKNENDAKGKRPSVAQAY